jgi:hypothetical protein
MANLGENRPSGYESTVVLLKKGRTDAMVLVTAVESGDPWAGIEEGGIPIAGAAHG